MIFPYRSVISATPDGEFLLLLRPEIPITVIGSRGTGTYVGLVDTGSDDTILPKSVADYLGIVLESETGPPARVFGGHRVELLNGKVILKLEANGELVAWNTSVSFFDFPADEEETVILGHAGFLDYFTATFDGKVGVLTLVPNDELPAIGSP